MLFINQYAGEFFSDVIETLRTMPGPHFLIAGESTRQWDDVRFLQCAALQKRGHLRRLISWIRFSIRAAVRICRYGRGQHLLFVTNPPIALWMAPVLGRILRLRYSILVYDLYPDAIIAMGLVSERSWIASVWNHLNALAFRGATHVIALAPGMARAIGDQSERAGKRVEAQVISGWADAEFFRPVPHDDNPIVRELGLTHKFIVGYAGSFGAAHGLKMITDCALELRDDPQIHFLLVGGGTREAQLRDTLVGQSLGNVTWLPSQPLERFRWIAPAFDLSLVLLRSGAGDAILPSKLYTGLAAGTATLAATDASSDLARIVIKHGYGVVVPPGDPSAMASMVRSLAGDRARLERYKRNARDGALRHHQRELQCRKYAELFGGKAR